jgi:hypothetical protein
LPGGGIYEAGRAHVDWLTFIDHLIGHLAWPLVVAGLDVFLSLRHRAAMDALLHRVRKAKAGPFEFEAELDKAGAAAEAARLPPAERISPQFSLQWSSRAEPEAWFKYLLWLADTDPRAAVIRAYHYLNQYAFEASKQLDPERTRYTSGSPAVMHAAAVAILAPEHVEVVDRLGEAALSADDPDLEISPRQAREYVELVARLVVAMRDRLRALLESDALPASERERLRSRRGKGQAGGSADEG